MLNVSNVVSMTFISDLQIVSAVVATQRIKMMQNVFIIIVIVAISC